MRKVPSQQENSANTCEITLSSSELPPTHKPVDFRLTAVPGSHPRLPLQQGSAQVLQTLLGEGKPPRQVPRVNYLPPVVNGEGSGAAASPPVQGETAPRSSPGSPLGMSLQWLLSQMMPKKAGLTSYAPLVEMRQIPPCSPTPPGYGHLSSPLWAESFCRRAPSGASLCL